MWCERLLAAIRRATDDDDCDAERVCASGFLTQLVAMHKKNGGNDARVVNREQLLARGLDLRCRPKKKQAKPGGAFVHWMAQREAARKEGGERSNMKEYRIWQKAEALEFKSLTQSELNVLEAEVAEAFEIRQDSEADADAASAIAQSRRSAVRTVLDVIGNSETPCTEHAFEEFVASRLGKARRDGEQKQLGFSAYTTLFRDRKYFSI